MITRREICLVILFIAVASLSASQCPTNEACYCQSSQDGVLEINCLTKNNSGFYVKIKPSQYIKITCTNSPKWSDFHLDVASLVKNDIKSIFFYTCDLPGNGSLGEITRMLGASNVEKLIFQSYKNLSSTLEKHHLDGFENLKELILSSNNMSYVDKDLLADLSNLTGLNLRENNLHLVKGFFDYTPELHWLELGENDLQSIEPGTFHNLKNLTYLNLWRNHLTELKTGVFDELVALKTLDINTNYLVSLPEDIFAKLESLNIINLSRNNFTHLPRYLLQNNAKIHNITLQSNLRNMTTLPNGFFANLTKLENLKLMRNGLITLPEDLLWGSSSLTHLNLNRNYLKSLPTLIFRDSKELIELELNFNDLEGLPDNIFVNTNRLKILDLSKNHITSISGHLFNGLYALEELNMEQNNLVTISSQACNYLTDLKIVKFSYNHLTLQSTSLEDIIDEYGKKSPFHNCFAIEELHLANNNISEIFSDWIFSNLKLRILDLKYNNIPYITAEDLQFVSNNIKVDLTHNKIQHILLHNAEQIATYQGIPRNTIILVEDNPLECDCELYFLLRYLEGRMHPSVQNYFHIIPGNLTCRSPDKSEIIQVTDLKSKSLTCRVTNIDTDFTCPEKCDCYRKPEGNAFVFDYSHKNLTRVPSDIKNPGHFLQLELNFSNNRLTQMPDLKKLKLEPVRKLILSHNNISDVFLDGLSETIQVLELHDNNLSRMRPNVLEFLKNCENLTRLTLHENRWACDCEAKDFLNFIQTKFVTIFDRRNVTCHETNSSISEMTLVDFCPFDKTMIISISIAISLMGLLIGTFGLLYYKYQRQIKVWLFAHQLCLWFVTEEELDKDKLFDAFVSYSQKDHDFVVDELVPKLENGPTPFKLCLHYRDWVAGEWIPVNIASSVEDSRRTIVVLSPNFLESVWGRMEFRAAHCQALSEGRARVILILYGDIGPTDNLDPELKAYISMNTYVKWGDPWFWDKLRYALPHQSKHAKKSIASKQIFENHQLYIQTNGDKKELIYPVETPLSTTPPADSLKLFICDKKPEEQLPLNESSQELYKLNDNVAIILTPEQLLKNDPMIDNTKCMA